MFHKKSLNISIKIPHIAVQNAVWNMIRIRFQDHTNASVKRLRILRINHGSFHILVAKLATNFCNQSAATNACCSAILVRARPAPRWCRLNVTAASYRRNRDVAMLRIGAAELCATKNMNLARTLVIACVMLENVPLV